jgi:hypothetical protein
MDLTNYVVDVSPMCSSPGGRMLATLLREELHAAWLERDR